METRVILTLRKGKGEENGYLAEAEEEGVVVVERLAEGEEEEEEEAEERGFLAFFAMFRGVVLLCLPARVGV